MGIIFIIYSFCLGFLGVIIDVNLFQEDVVLFRLAFFLLPSLYAIGKIYDKVILNNKNDKDHEK